MSVVVVRDGAESMVGESAMIAVIMLMLELIVSFFYFPFFSFSFLFSSLILELSSSIRVEVKLASRDVFPFASCYCLDSRTERKIMTEVHELLVRSCLMRVYGGR